MPKPLHVDIFCEDRGHESFVRSVVLKIAESEGIDVSLRTRFAQGGKGRVRAEFDVFQRAARAGKPTGQTPDLLVVVIDCNCSDWHEVRDNVKAQVDEAVFPRSVVGCPDPHVERWYMADPPSFAGVVGHDPTPVADKCDRDIYKRDLVTSLRKGGNQVLSGGTEFAPDIVGAMDLYAAGRRQRSLRHFVDDLRTELKDAARP